MILDHICFAVNNLSEAITYWQKIFGYNKMTNPVVNTRQKVKVVFLNKKDSLTIKIIEPLEGNKSLKNFVEYGGGFHHICFRCEDLNKTINMLVSDEVKMLVPPQPGEAFNNNDIAFFMGKYKTVFELIDTTEKAQQII